MERHAQKAECSMCLLFPYRFRPSVKEGMSSAMSYTGLDACGDGVSCGFHLAVVARCRNQTLFLASTQKPVSIG